MSRWSTLLFVALVCVVSLPLLSQSRPVVVIGESEGADRTTNYAPLIAHLNAGSAYTYTFKHFASHEQLYDALAAKRIDFALMGPMQYVRAHHAYGAVPVVTDGKSYTGVLIVPSSSSVRGPKDLAGKRLAFAYDQSSSGHLLPLLRLSRAGIRPPAVVEGCGKAPKGVACYDFVGGHAAVAEAVRAGSYDAGGVIDDVAERTKGVRVVDRSDPFPAVPLVAHPKVPSALLADIRSRILSYKAPAGSASHPFYRGAVVVTDADFNQVRFVAKVVLGETYR